MLFYPVVGRERFGAFGVSIFLIYFLFNGEPRSYLEFPNHLTVLEIYPLVENHTWLAGKSPMNGGFIRTNADKWSIFQQAMFDYRKAIV